MSEEAYALGDEETNKQEDGSGTGDASNFSGISSPRGKSRESSTVALKSSISKPASDMQEDSSKPKPIKKARFVANRQDLSKGRISNREENKGKKKTIDQEEPDSVKSVVDDVPKTKRKKLKKGTRKTHNVAEGDDTANVVEDVEMGELAPQEKTADLRAETEFIEGSQSNASAAASNEDARVKSPDNREDQGTSEDASDEQKDLIKTKKKGRIFVSERDFFRGRVKNRDNPPDLSYKGRYGNQEKADRVESLVEDVPEIQRKEEKTRTKKTHIGTEDGDGVKFVENVEMGELAPKEKAADLETETEFVEGSPADESRPALDDQQESAVFIDGAVAGETPTELPVEAAETTKIGIEGAVQSESLSDPVNENGIQAKQVLVRGRTSRRGPGRPLRNPDPNGQHREATKRSAPVFVQPSREEVAAIQEPQMRNPDPDKAHEGATEEASDIFAKPRKMPEEVAETTKISLEGAVQSESLSDPVHETGMVVHQVLVRGEAKDEVAKAGSRGDSGRPLRNPDPSGQLEEATEGLAGVFEQPSTEEVAAMEEPRMRNPDPDRANEGVTEEASDIFARPRKNAEEPTQNLPHEEKSRGEEEMKHEDTTEPRLRNPDPLYHSEELQDAAEEFSRPSEKVNKEKSATDENENQVPENEFLSGKDQNDIGNVDDDELPWAMYRDIKKIDKDVEEDDGFSADDESDSEGRPTGNHLPALYEYLGSLDNGDTELESKHIPPSLFENEYQHHMHKGVDEMKLALAEEEIGEYLEEFEKQVEEEVLMIGSIGLEEVQDEERRIREEHIDFQRAEAKVQRDKKQELAAAMDRAKKHVMKVFREKYGRVRDKEMALMRRDRRIQGQITKAFRRSENQLLKALRKRKNEVQAMYGDLVFADRQFGGGKGKRWKVNWDKTHQPIQIKLKCLRSVRDKMPLGEYVLMVSLYSRLGGHVMKWSNLRGQKWGAATSPLVHDGEYYNTELKVDQSVFTVCPSKPDMRPGMVLMFELFILRGSFTPTDKVVAWGCFPICDGGFNVVEGKYKTPLLRGVIDPSIDKFQTIEELIAFDLEYWLCNMYFEIIKLPRYLMGQKEYEVEMQFSSGLVSYPIRTKTGEEFIDGEQPVYGSTTDMSSIAASRVSMPSSVANSYLSIREESQETKPPGHITLTVERPKRKTSRPTSAVSLSMKLQKASEISSELRQRRTSRTSRTSISIQPAEDSVSRKLPVYGSRRSVDERSIAFSDETDTGSGTDYNDDDVYNVKKDNGFKRVKDQPGMYYKVHQNNPIDVYCRKVYNTMPKTAQPSTRRKKKKKLTRQDELRQHTYNVKSLWSNKGHVPRKGREKVQYIGRMMLAELGLSQWRKGQFWLTLLMLVITWFMRMYLHYFGQWILLKALSIPINKFNFYAHTVNLNYQDTLLQARHEIGVVMMGPVTNFFFFTIFVPLTLMFQRLFKWFPDIITHFILAFGIQTFLDPAWIVIVDSALGRYKNTGGVEPIGDAFKLYWHFFRNYRNDDVTFYVSVSMTVFLYCVIAFSTAALWYMFFVRLHNNGRLMDVYWRLHGSEEEFFLPYDLEVSNEELNYICRKSEQWRGEEGERRKVAVYDYVWEQEELADEYWDDPNAHGKKTGAKEITTHVSIHSIHPDGLIELHRQFLRLPDGAIIEVFGEMNMPGIDEGVKQALMKRTGFKGVSNTVRRSRSLSVSSVASSAGGGGRNRKAPLRRTSSNRLDIPV